MAAFRVLGQFVQYLLDDGQVNAGGSVTFYETDLTTLKNTYTDPTLTVPNSNPVMLTADGRLSSDVWGDGEYGAELKDSDGVILETLNNIQSGADPGFVIPALIAGAFLTNDGSNLQWDNDVANQLLPDMAGEAGNILYTDGSIAYWDSPPEIPPVPEPETVISAGSFKQGDGSGTNFCLQQWGTGSAPNSGTKETQVAVVFATAYAATPGIQVTPTGGPFTTGNGVTGYYADVSIISQSNTGFTVKFNTNHGESNSDGNINTTIPFNWHAIGLTTS